VWRAVMFRESGAVLRRLCERWADLVFGGPGLSETADGCRRCILRLNVRLFGKFMSQVDKTGLK